MERGNTGARKVQADSGIGEGSAKIVNVYVTKQTDFSISLLSFYVSFSQIKSSFSPFLLLIPSISVVRFFTAADAEGVVASSHPVLPSLIHSPIS